MSYNYSLQTDGSNSVTFAKVFISNKIDSVEQLQSLLKQWLNNVSKDMEENKELVYTIQ
jgi:hypothetical protein